MLVEPLYGKNDIHIGVRELLQNAVDACRELQDFCRHSARTPPPTVQDSAVLVQLTGDDQSGFTLTISDRGIGMTAETLCRYFLRAGASYRRSDTWKKLHEEGAGHSRVLRSGRFGIGVLAAFLLGDEIAVTTRHIDAPSDRAITFTATLETDQLEMRWCTAPIGTKISIRLHEAASKAFKGLRSSFPDFGHLPDNVYLLSSPSIQMLLPDHQDVGNRWPSAGEMMQNGWRRICPPGFQEVHWRYFPRPTDMSNYVADGLACNGFAVSSHITTDKGWREECGGYGFKMPAISVFDPDGQLPLTLQRTGLRSTRLPFQAELINDICQDILANLLVDSRAENWFANGILKDVPISHHRALEGDYWINARPHLVLGREGFSIQDDWIIWQLISRRLLVIQGSGFELRRPESETFVTSLSSLGSLQQSDMLAQTCFDGRQFQLRTGGLRLTVSSTVAKRWPNQRFTKFRYESLKLTSETQQFRVYEHGHCGEASAVLNMPGDGKWLVAEIFPKQNKQPVTQTPLGRTFMEYLGTTVIPYSMEERRERFGHVFNELKCYMTPQRSSARKRKSR